ncbi:hypothetical protein MJO28_015632 [Puccinia striiformis f. sp. tritici]|uniref:Uncharacterized protein n=4 Tax=Puccinia striiformis TaxID=27350 RepID=A0A0L0VNV4_9BASI|nr:hypothetical protein Pst134EA_029380 [Puccinia striiformis f. sp. tritici]KAI9624186.1 hypothetical protein KEM48_009084 [Puccinia striiformis f. sp. tritici PST-130]KNF00941.1 hypothetical protein PSTG_05836 [Puccinia striiformis f. sp. tritici PST-78]POW02161.1 hypothetical protein PSHT_12185 [Puccinia striiformis]KAH9441363.1 hypothetical protein Pst134EB_030031 [Puccinia striiformis f. sp. tritici]KAH9447341.1 hypothetical protein Pst134EA_029380 [Puccinia striiformis f. sp. tritici]
MVLQDKYKRATSSRYRATHGGIQSNRQKAKSDINQHKEDFPDLPQTTLQTDTEIPPSESDPDHSFARRQLASNADRYLEPEPDPNLEPEPEIDLTEFIEKHKTRITEEERNGGRGSEKEEEDIDESFNDLYRHSSSLRHQNNSKNGNKPTKVFIEDPNYQLQLEELDNERKKADATRDLIARFSGHKLDPSRSKVPPTRNDPIPSKTTGTSNELVLPLDDQDFLDEVLNDSSGTYGKSKRT